MEEVGGVVEMRMVRLVEEMRRTEGRFDGGDGELGWAVYDIEEE